MASLTEELEEARVLAMEKGHERAADGAQQRNAQSGRGLSRADPAP